MAKDPAFSFYAQDFIIDTTQWTRAAKGLHCELLSIAWINGFIEANEKGEPLEMDEEGLKLWRSRVGKKWVLTDGRLYNNRLEETRETRKRFKQKQSEKGRKSAEKRASENQPRFNHGSTTVQPASPVEPLEEEYEKEKEYKNGIGVSDETTRGFAGQMLSVFKTAIPRYEEDRERDAPALLSIAKFLCQRGNLRGAPEHNVDPVLEAWEHICAYIATDTFYRQKAIKTISNCIQEILNKALNGDQSKPTETGRRGAKLDDDKLKAGIRDRIAKRGHAAG